MTSYLTSIDTFSVSRTVPEIFDFKFFRVRPWLSTLKGHVTSKIFTLFESPYMTSYLTSIDTFYLVPFPRKIGSKFWRPHKMAEFGLFKVKVINRYLSFLEKGLTLAKWRWLTYHASKSIQLFWLYPHQRAWKVKKIKEKKKKRKKKRTNPYIFGIYLPLFQRIFPKPNFARLFRSMTLSIGPNIFSIGSLGWLWQRVKLSHFQCKPWVAITTVVLPYKCDYNILRYDRVDRPGGGVCCFIL